MASKVNSRFVAILACVLIIVFGGVTVMAYVALTRSGDRYIRKGDEAAAAGDFVRAASFYERAVGKRGGRTQREWLEKWRDALVKTTPKSPLDYGKALQFYIGIQRTLAELEPENAESQLEYVESRYKLISTLSNSRSVLEDFVADVNIRIEDLDPESPIAKRIIGYRGLAALDLMGRTQLSEEERQTALKDLELAATDPTNHDAILGVATWHFTKGDSEQRAGRRTDADASNARGIEVVESFLAQNPGHPRAMLMQFSARRAQALGKQSSMTEQRAVLKSFNPQAEQLLDRLAAIDAKDFSPPVLSAARTLPQMTGEALHAEKYLAITERVSAERPNDATILLIRGEALEGANKLEEAIGVYQRVVDLPQLPVSIEGYVLPYLQRRAVSAQFDASIQAWSAATTPEARTAALAQAKKFRDKLAELTEVGTEDELLRCEAMLALSEGRFDEAVAKLSGIRSRMQNDDPRILLSLAEALYRQRNVGEARLIYERLRNDGHRQPSLYLRLADVYFAGMQDSERAREVLNELLQFDPENAAAKSMLGRVDVAQGKAGTDTLDPVLAAIVNAGELQGQGKLAEARDLLEKQAAKTPDDRRLLESLVQIDIAEGERSRALERVKVARRSDPEDQRLRQMEVALSASDPLEAGLKLIEDAGGTPLQRALARFHLYARHDKAAEARAAYRDAESIAPNDPSVIEIGFVLAIEDKDWERARAAAGRAAEANLDQLDGALFQGRLELARGQYREAATTFKRAADRIPEKPDTWRWLGAAQVLTGDVQNAIASYKRALDARPNDIVIGKEYARALMAVGRQSDALAVLNPETGVLRFGSGDDEAVGMWLDLEGIVGNRGVAIERRKQAFGRNPADASNAESLARLQIVDGRYAEAEETIRAIEAAKSLPPLNIALIRGELLSRGGDPADADPKTGVRRGNPDKAAAHLRAFIGSVPADQRTVNMYTRSAELLARFDRQSEAVEILNSGRDYQAKDRMEIDRQLGDLLFRTGINGLAASEQLMSAGQTATAEEYATRARSFLEQARDAYQKVIAAGADASADGYAVTKRLAETYAKLGDNRAADAAIQAMINRQPADQRAAMESDREVLLLRSQFAKGAGDVRRARELLDRACERYPTDPAVFVRRAMLNEEDPSDSMFADVIADLDKAVQLRPGMTEAWRLRFAYFKKRGRLEDAFTELRKGIESNPNDNTMKQVLVNQLMSEGRTSEAVGEAVRFARANMEDMDWLRLAADMCYRNGQYREASEFYYVVWLNSEESLELAGLVLDSTLLRKDDRLNRGDVAKFLSYVEKIPTPTRENLMLRARAHLFLGQSQRAEELSRQAFALCGDDTYQLSRWFSELTSVVGSQEFAYKLLGEMAKQGTMPPIIRIARFGDAVAGKSVAEQNAELDDIEKQLRADDRLAWMEFSRLMLRVTYGQKRYDDVVRWGKRGLEILPNDWELNNGVAYVLVKHLGKPQEALPFAERAVAAADQNSSGLDTLGVVYLQLGRFRDAERQLARAVQTAKAPEEQLVANIHLGQALLKLEDAAGARRASVAAQEAYRRSAPGIQSEYKADLDSLSEAAK